MPATASHLSDVFLRNLRNPQKTKYADGGGLFLYISLAGGNLWRLAYRFGGKQKLLSFGAYPEVGLKRARQLRDEARERLAAGIDPGLHKKAVQDAAETENRNVFEVLAREWFAKNCERWAKSNSDKIIARLENDLFPFIEVAAR